jgi:ATP-dependent exoDNAse (exonuclease V) beta subunit
MSEILDQSSRDRFANEITQPFWVTAPAGVGKTHAIVERVCNMLRAGEGNVALVTYTNKAAAEMRARLEEKINLLPHDRIFTGTIHALSLMLLKKHSAQWGILGVPEVVQDAEGLWNRFLEEVPNPIGDLPNEVQERFMQSFGSLPPELIMKTKGSPSGIFTESPGFSFEAIHKAQVKGSAKQTIARLEKWAATHEAGLRDGFVAVPELPDAPQKESQAYEAYEKCFGAYEKWRTREGMRYAQYIGECFRQWRLSRGLYLYEDLIDSVAQKAKEGYGLSIVLDEAQDTSPEQLGLLIKLAERREGRLQLTMVGDPQQSIYADRARLPYYQSTRKLLVGKYGAEELTFNVTFRCSERVVDWVNQMGEDIFSKSDTQASFVKLRARPNATRGGVFRWKLKGEMNEDADTDERAWALARNFSKRLSELGIPREQAHKVAIIAPRREWLYKLGSCLGDRGWAVQIHADSPSATLPERVLRAVVYLMAYPFDGFELLGLLREFTEATDRELATAARKDPGVYNLAKDPPESGLPDTVRRVLHIFHLAWRNHLHEPLDSAVVGFLKDSQIDDKMKALATIYGEDLTRQWELERSRILSLASPGLSARELLSAMGNSRSEETPEEGALQLMTMHKAKGLEWHTVIIPFLHRSLNPPKQSYPIVDASSDGSLLTWHMPPQEAARPERENLERLLYVAMTRPRENLVLVDDSDFFEKNRGSAAELLGLLEGGRHRKDFLELPIPGRLAFPDAEEIPAIKEAPAQRLIKLDRRVVVRTPSSLEEERSAVETTGVDGGIEYGNYWHALWGELPSGDLERELMRRAQGGEYAKRAQNELDSLFRNRAWEIIKKGRAGLMYAEYPFIVRVKEYILEGRADLVLKTEEKTVVIDWKTDRLPMEEIARIYHPQLKAYKDAFHGLTTGPVEVFLYSTYHGELIEDS